jgi:hypothetical protein
MSLSTLEQLKAWADLLPADYAAEIGDPDPSAAPHLAVISAALPALKDSDSVLAFVSSNEDAFIGVGRAGRVRFLAWYMSLGLPERSAVMDRFSEGEEEGGRGTTKVAPYFKSDMEAIAATLGRRVAHGMVDTYTLEMITGASREAVEVIELRGGKL